MLKVIGHSLLSLLLLVTTIGMTVSKHYCGGELVSVSVFHEAEPCCDMPGCCANENHTYQVKDDYSSPVLITVPDLAELDIPGHDLFESTVFTEQETENGTPFIYEPPPPKTIQTVLSLKQVYLL